MDKKILIIASVILITISMAIGIFSYIKQNQLDLTKNTPQISEEILNISMISKNTENNLFKEDLEYPKFNNNKFVLLNSEIESFVKSQIDIFEKSSAENWKARQTSMEEEKIKQEYPDDPFDFSLRWKPIQINNDYVSIIINASYYNGGANGVSDLKTFNFDIKNNKILKLEDVANKIPKYLNVFSEQSRNQLQNNLNIINNADLKKMIDSGTEPLEDNFKNFTFDKYKITIHFKKYQVAPGAAGEQSIDYYLNQK